MNNIKGVTHIALKEKGEQGATGPIYLPRGEWQVNATYTRTDEVIEFVIFEGYAYEVLKPSVTGGSDPHDDIKENGGNWKSMGRYDVVATKVLLADFAIIAGAVFWNSRLMSQQGTDNNGNPSTTFTGYNEDASGNETGTFHPNVLINFISGYLKMLKGKIAGWTLQSNKLVSQTGAVFLDGATGEVSFADGKILLKSDGSGKLAGGNVSWTAGGNVTLNNITANGGTFKGVVNANGGIQVGARRITGSDTLTASDSFIMVEGSASVTFIVYLPANPLTGQMITIVNRLDNQLTIVISIQTGELGSIIQQGMSKSIQLANYRAKQLIYYSYRWYVVGQYDY